jgi:hypothetical protein
MARASVMRGGGQEHQAPPRASSRILNLDFCLHHAPPHHPPKLHSHLQLPESLPHQLHLQTHTASIHATIMSDDDDFMQDSGEEE